MRMRAGITIYMSLSLVIMTGLFLALLESARVYGLKAHSRMESELLMESKMAEYNPTLYADYHLYFLEANTDGALELNPLEESMYRLGNENLTVGGKQQATTVDFYEMKLDSDIITEYQLATDWTGASYRKQVAEYMKQTILLSELERYYEQAMQSQDMQDEAEQIDEKIEHADRKISEIEALEDVDSEDMTGLEDGDITMKDITVTPELMQQAKQTENPLEKVKEMKNTGILSLVVDDVSELSELAIDTTDDISKRSLYQGNYKTEDTTSEFAEGLFFREYMLREFGNYRSQENSGVLKYAQEYLIAGKTTDKDNLTAVVERLLAVREVVNYLHIRKDPEKIALAHAMAVAIGGVSLNPIVIAVIKEGILAAWAFTDSVEDVRILLNGGRVPFLQKADGTDHGLCYEDYLRIFLYLTGEEKLVMRSLNYMEKDVRLKSGQEQFRMDCMISAMKVVYTYQAEPLFWGILHDNRNTTYSLQETRQFSY